MCESMLTTYLHAMGTPICKNNGTLSLDMDINALMSVLQKYANPAIDHYMLTYRCGNFVCVRLIIV